MILKSIKFENHFSRWQYNSKLEISREIISFSCNKVLKKISHVELFSTFIKYQHSYEIGITKTTPLKGEKLQNKTIKYLFRIIHLKSFINFWNLSNVLINYYLFEYLFFCYFIYACGYLYLCSCIVTTNDMYDCVLK